MSDIDDMSRQQAEATAEHLAELWQAIDHREECDDPDECEECAAFRNEYGDDEPMDVLRERPLELVWERGEPFAVVLGVGGPHTEITGGGRASGSGYVLETYWGGGTAKVRSEAVTRTGELFREYVEEVGDDY